MTTRLSFRWPLLVLVLSSFLVGPSAAWAKEPPAVQPARKQKPRAARDEEPIVRLRGNRHVSIRARSVKLRKSAYDRIREIAKRYHEATKRKLVVTGGDRTPRRQAELMYKKMSRGENLLRLYTRVRLVLPLVKVYEKGKKDKRKRRQIVREMTSIIIAQVEKGQYVSRHLANTAADVRSRGLKESQIKALKAAVKSVPGARLVDERESEAPHFHLSL